MVKPSALQLADRITTSLSAARTYKAGCTIIQCARLDLPSELIAVWNVHMILAHCLAASITTVPTPRELSVHIVRHVYRSLSMLRGVSRGFPQEVERVPAMTGGCHLSCTRLKLVIVFILVLASSGILRLTLRLESLTISQHACTFEIQDGSCCRHPDVDVLLRPGETTDSER